MVWAQHAVLWECHVHARYDLHSPILGLLGHLLWVMQKHMIQRSETRAHQ